eukprot:CAMPEP_0168247294 /NCGR_PEP_ID=MMETSP0141_2-20121125/814_1 /TAXON_ID=44445 /ORGANISM="Pseudo-nitzschia australis, Strain 10249 10 AB" /LENGTH=237 /DNA_ID=CAMNT_0008183057 /DNA_START=204 /DNA_END=918 /DNA_ORIENTATION=-
MIDPSVFAALWYLQDYFQMSKVRKQMHDPCSQSEVLAFMYRGAIELRKAGLHEETVKNVISEYCVKHHDASTTSFLDNVADLPLWLSIVSILPGRVEDSRAWSKDIAKFLDRENDIDVTYNAIQQLTSKAVLPAIDPEAASILLSVEQKYSKDSAEDNYDKNNRGGDTTNDHGGDQEQMTDLQQRCVDALVESNLENCEKKQLRHRAIRERTKTPIVIESYLEQILASLKLTKSMLK